MNGNDIFSKIKDKYIRDSQQYMSSQDSGGLLGLSSGANSFIRSRDSRFELMMESTSAVREV
jgi:hypothetical protein